MYSLKRASGPLGPDMGGSRSRGEGRGGALLRELPPTLWFCYSGPVDINIVAKCNACLSSPCKNNGTCSQDPVEQYRCTCPYSYKVRWEAPPTTRAQALPLSWLQGEALCS